MWVVIFRAHVRQLDDDYGRTAQRMRELALTQFGCLAFQAVTEGSEEVALSYWPDPASIAAWRAHPEHLEAQRLGRERWYRRWSVEVAQVQRSYQGESRVPSGGNSGGNFVGDPGRDPGGDPPTQTA